jgi:methionine aminopeptidase
MQISSSSTGLAYDVAIAQKVNQSTREQGRQALELIQSAMAPTANASAGVGSRLNIVA